MSFHHPEVFWGLLSLLLLFLLTFWRVRPQKITVSSLYFWDKIKDRNPPLRALRKPHVSWMLLLQAVVVFFGVSALAKPFLEYPTSPPRKVVLIMDASASMKTREPHGVMRWDKAVAQVEQLFQELTAQDKVIVASTHAAQTLYETDKGGARKYLKVLRPSDCEENISDFCSNVLSTVSADPDTYFFGVSDRPIAVKQTGSNFFQIAVGGKTDNLGITRADITERADGMYDLFVLVENFSRDVRKASLLIEGETPIVPKQNYDVLPGSNPLIFPKLALEKVAQVSIKLLVEDNFAEDNEVIATRDVVKPLEVLFVGNDHSALRKALTAVPNVHVSLAAEKTLDKEPDLVIYYERVPSENLRQPSLVIHPPRGFGPFQMGDLIEKHGIDAGVHALLRYVEPEQIKISGAREIRTDSPDVEAVMTMDKKPVAVLWKNGGAPCLLFSFPFRAVEGGQELGWITAPYGSFPIFWANYIQYLQQTHLHKNPSFVFHRTHEPIEVMPDIKKVVFSADKSEVTLFTDKSSGASTFIPHRVGGYILQGASGQETRAYANLLNARASNNGGEEHLLPPHFFQAQSAARLQHDMSIYLLWVFFALAVLYWYLEARR